MNDSEFINNNIAGNEGISDRRKIPSERLVRARYDDDDGRVSGNEKNIRKLTLPAGGSSRNCRVTRTPNWVNVNRRRAAVSRTTLPLAFLRIEGEDALISSANAYFSHTF